MILRIAVALVLAVSGVNGAWAKVESKPSLVVLAEHKSKQEQDRRLLDQISRLMIEKNLSASYKSIHFLDGELANPYTFTKTVTQLARNGNQVDIFVLVPDEEKNRGATIPLSQGTLTEAHLKKLEAKLAGLPGGVRVVFASSGAQLASRWRALGAESVLVYPASQSTRDALGGLAQFGLPMFLKRWAQGRSLTESAQGAWKNASSAVNSFSQLVDPSSWDEGEVYAKAPVFAGLDLTVTNAVKMPVELNDVRWPEKREREETYAHTNLGEGLLQILGKTVSGELELEPKRMTGIEGVIGLFNEPVWQSARMMFPGRTDDEVIVPGTDIRVILGKVIPDVDKYFQALIDQLDTLTVNRGKGKISVDVWLATDHVDYKLREERDSKTGQPYSVRLGRHMHLEIHALRDSLTVDRISGITTMIKLPVVPDGINPRKLLLDTSTEKLTINAQAVGDLINVVGTADVRAKKFTGIDWVATIWKNWPVILGFVFFIAI